MTNEEIEELKQLNDNARLLLSKYDGVFAQLNEEKQALLTEIAQKGEEGLEAIQELLNSGNVAQAENALKFNNKSFEEIEQMFAGIGGTQKWVDTTNDREKDIIYTNTTNKPIVVNVNFPSSSTVQKYALLVDDIEIVLSDGGGDEDTLSAIVPPGSTYEAKNDNYEIKKWMELR